MNILKFYNKSLQGYKRKYKSIHWLKYDNRKHLFNLKGLKNFRNNGLSKGLDDQYFIKKQKKIFHDLINNLGENYVLSNLNTTNIGNNKNVFKYKKYIVDAGHCFHIKLLHELENYVFVKKKAYNILEIGAGYGGLASKIINKINCKYFIIDLPEANLLSSYYLSKMFQKKKINISTPWKKFKNIKFDLIINTRSMQEMNYKIILEYFKYIQKNLKKNGFFLNVNRYTKSTVGERINFYEFPYDNNWKVIISKKSWRQNWIHLLLTRRQFKNKIDKKKFISEIKNIYFLSIFYILIDFCTMNIRYVWLVYIIIIKFLKKIFK